MGFRDNSFLNKSTRQRRAMPIMLAATAALAAGNRAIATTNNWINPAGGSWGDNTNWSLGSPGNDATFNLGSTAGYTVTVPAGTSIASTMFVRTDRVTFSLGGNKLQTSGPFQGTVNVGATAGENGSLTISGTSPILGTEYFDGDYGFNVGTAGTGTLTVNQAQVRSTHGAFTIGASGMLTAQNGAVVQSSHTSYIYGSASFDHSTIR